VGLGVILFVALLVVFFVVVHLQGNLGISVIDKKNARFGFEERRTFFVKSRLRRRRLNLFRRRDSFLDPHLSRQAKRHRKKIFGI
jgi:hypothetical protein